jgi:hypothetical protein
MKQHSYPKTVPQKRAINAHRRRRENWMAGFATKTAGKGRLFH